MNNNSNESTTYNPDSPQHDGSSASQGMMIKRGPWTEDEDEMLLQYVDYFGISNWVRIASYLKSRTPKQCRERYHQNLKPSLNKTPISEEEGIRIEELVAHIGKKWAEIARIIGNGRSDNTIKNWWNGGQNKRKRKTLREQQHLKNARLVNGTPPTSGVNTTNKVSPHHVPQPRLLQQQPPPPPPSGFQQQVYQRPYMAQPHHQLPPLVPATGPHYTTGLQDPVISRKNSYTFEYASNNSLDPSRRSSVSYLDSYHQVAGNANANANANVNVNVNANNTTIPSSTSNVPVNSTTNGPLFKRGSVALPLPANPMTPYSMSSPGSPNPMNIPSLNSTTNSLASGNSMTSLNTISNGTGANTPSLLNPQAHMNYFTSPMYGNSHRGSIISLNNNNNNNNTSVTTQQPGTDFVDHHPGLTKSNSTNNLMKWNFKFNNGNSVNTAPPQASSTAFPPSTTQSTTQSNADGIFKQHYHMAPNAPLSSLSAQPSNTTASSPLAHVQVNPQSNPQSNPHSNSNSVASATTTTTTAPSITSSDQHMMMALGRRGSSISMLLNSSASSKANLTPITSNPSSTPLEEMSPEVQLKRRLSKQLLPVYSHDISHHYPAQSLPGRRDSWGLGPNTATAPTPVAGNAATPVSFNTTPVDTGKKFNPPSGLKLNYSMSFDAPNIGSQCKTGSSIVLPPIHNIGATTANNSSNPGPAYQGHLNS